MKATRLKITCKTAPSGGVCTIQVTKSTNINGAKTFSDVTGFTGSIADGDFLVEVNPSDVNLAEGDILSFDVDAINSAENIMVEVIGRQMK